MILNRQCKCTRIKLWKRNVTAHVNPSVNARRITTVAVPAGSKKKLLIHLQIYVICGVSEIAN